MKKGFTLIELLVVIAIIGILSAIGLVSLNGAREKARDAQAKSDLGQMRTALTLYSDDNGGAYPGEQVNDAADASAFTGGGGGAATAGSIWIDGGPIITAYLAQELSAPADHGYEFLTNNSADAGAAESCSSTDCYVMFYLLETGAGDRYYMLFEDGSVVDYGTGGGETVAPVCADGGNCTVAP